MEKAYKKFKGVIQTSYFKYALFFMGGLGLGYLLGSTRILNKTSHLFKFPHFQFTWLNHIPTSLGSFLPNINFLTDVVAFEATAFALIIPLTIDILFRISERYDSDVIPKLFMRNMNIKFHVWLIAVSIALNVFLRFLTKEPVDGLIWRFGAWIIFGSFIYISLVIVRYLTRFIAFASDTTYVKEQLLKDAKKSIQ